MNSPMAQTPKLTGTLSILLHHRVNACPFSGLQAAGLLERWAEDPALDENLRDYCKQFSRRLYQQSREQQA